MSRRRIRNTPHSPRPHGRDAVRGSASGYQLEFERQRRHEQEEADMKRLIDEGLVDIESWSDASYISRTARLLGWNQTRFKCALERVALPASSLLRASVHGGNH
jgi:hypothetical protein